MQRAGLIEEVMCETMESLDEDGVEEESDAEDNGRSWPSAQLELVDDAGHSALEPSILKRLVAATNAHRG